MNPNILPSNRAVLMAAIDPERQAPGTLSSGWVSMADFQNILAAVMAGTFSAATANVNAKLRQATDSSGTGAKDITGKAITALVNTTSPGDDNKQALINLRADELDVANNFSHVQLQIIVADTASPAVATVDVAGAIFGLDARQQPATDATTVAEVVS